MGTGAACWRAPGAPRVTSGERRGRGSVARRVRFDEGRAGPGREGLVGRHVGCGSARRGWWRASRGRGTTRGRAVGGEPSRRAARRRQNGRRSRGAAVGRPASMAPEPARRTRADTRAAWARGCGADRGRSGWAVWPAEVAQRGAAVGGSRAPVHTPPYTPHPRGPPAAPPRSCTRRAPAAARAQRGSEGGASLGTLPVDRPSSDRF